MPAIPQKRGVSRVRYQRMILESLADHNNKIAAENAEIAWCNTEYSLRKKSSSGGCGGLKKPKPFMSEEEAFHSRKKECSFLRFRIFRQLHDAGYSYPSIGSAAGMDHTTILSGVRKINLIEPLPILVAEGSTIHTEARIDISVTEGAEGAANLNQPPALVEIPVVAVAA